MASSEILQVAESFWNIRGEFKIGHFVNIGTHTSLIRLASGKFVFLDAYTLDPATKDEVDRLTNGGADITAILNLHPFHTVHVTRMHEMFPGANLYGTARHVAMFPSLPWEVLHTEDPELHERFADDLSFSVPAGVELIPANQNVHFSSVLALHRASQTIHVDDTFMVLSAPPATAWMGLGDYVGLHPTLWQALEKRAGAAQDFRQWAEELADDWGDAENLCAAHSASLTATNNRGAPLRQRMLTALKHVDWTLKAHEKRYG